MRLFLWQLDVVLDESRSLKDRTEVLEAMFGESVAQQVVEDIAGEVGWLVQTGNHLLGASGGILAAPATVSARSAAKTNTFYGSKWPRK